MSGQRLEKGRQETRDSGSSRVGKDGNGQKVFAIGDFRLTIERLEKSAIRCSSLITRHLLLPDLSSAR
jgi:hypothetical protein